jgi:hypothetical protein
MSGRSRNLVPKPGPNIKYRPYGGWCSVRARMTRQQPETDYAVVITKLDDGFELQIRELLISVRAGTLADGWVLIQERVQEVIDCARSAGVSDELPSPLPPPPV